MGVDLRGSSGGHMPLGSGALGGDAACHRDERFAIGIGRGQGDLDAEFEFLDAHGDLEEGAADGFERRLAPERAAGRGLARYCQTNTNWSAQSRNR